MDELSRASRIARRLALAATICCCANNVHAGAPPGTTQTSLRSLLSKGWTDTDTTAGIDRSAAKSPVVKAAPSMANLTSTPSTVQVAPDASTAESVIVKPKLRVLEVPSVLAHVNPNAPKATEPEQIAGPLAVPAKTSKIANEIAASSLAELIKRRTKPIVVPKLASNSESIKVEHAPTAVNRLDVEKRISENITRLESEVDFNVRAAEPIQAEPIQAEPIQAEPIVQVQEDSIQAHADSMFESESKAKPEEVAAVAEVKKPGLESEAGDDDVEAPAAVNEIAQVEPTDNAPVPTPSAELIVEEKTRSALDEITSTPVTDRSRRIANDSGFDLLPLKGFETDSASKLESEHDQPSLTATIHATRLREIAQESLRNANHRLQRGATHSAKKFAVEALRSIVAMRDAQSGGNQHAKHLDVAFDAIRESDDFCGRFGAIDENSLSRMVAVHETIVLKGQDIQHVSALEATETYLDVARTNLVLAAGGEREASDALILLGKVEKQMSDRGDTHGSAVAVTLQRAAVEIAPTNAFGYRELGTTLLKQGLVQQAAWALNRSVEIEPTRSGYQRLLEASRRLGDVDTARVCLTSLQKPELRDEIPVRTLSPEAFAATHRPVPKAIEPAKVEPKSAARESPKPAEAKVSLRSLFPFGRR